MPTLRPGQLSPWARYAVALGCLATSLVVLPSTAESGQARFPRELHGAWDLGPEPCTLPTHRDADSPIRIESTKLVGYEHVETPASATRVSRDPMAWVIVTASDIAPGVRVADLYVLKQDDLTITDGRNTRHYRRCR